MLATIALFSCNDNRKQEKALLTDVIKTHDKLMNDDGLIMKNKMKLKALAIKDTSPVVKDSVAAYTKLLDDADDIMMGWMNKFNPDFTGKSHEEIMTYLGQQKAQILKIDGQLKSAVKASDTYLIKVNQK